MIEEHLDFAAKGAGRYTRMYGGRFTFDEFSSAAYLGLMIAARKFDPTRDVKFTSYAFNWIDAQLKRLPMLDRRQTGWTYQHNSTGKAAGKTGMERVIGIDQWPEMKNKDGKSTEFDAKDPASPLDCQVIDKLTREQQRARVLAVVGNAKAQRFVAAYLDGLTMQEISTREGLTRQRIHQILGAALKRAARILGPTDHLFEIDMRSAR